MLMGEGVVMVVIKGEEGGRGGQITRHWQQSSNILADLLNGAALLHVRLPIAPEIYNIRKRHDQ